MTINEAKKQYEMHQTILQIQNSLIDFPGGRLIDQGDMLQDGELKVKFGEASKVKLRLDHCSAVVRMLCLFHFNLVYLGCCGNNTGHLLET